MDSIWGEPIVAVLAAIFAVLQARHALAWLDRRAGGAEPAAMRTVRVYLRAVGRRPDGLTPREVASLAATIGCDTREVWACLAILDATWPGGNRLDRW